jgi:hypothetical protein
MKSKLSNTSSLMRTLLATALALSGCTNQPGTGGPGSSTASNNVGTGAGIFAAMTAGLSSTTDAGTWFLAGSAPQEYLMSGDPTGTAPDSLLLSSSVATGSDFGTAMTDSDPSPHFGKRVELSATVRTEGVVEWAGLWMRVDGPGGAVLQFDNMQNRPISGTEAAASYTVVLDVASNATNLAYGVLLVGSGTATVSSLTIQDVPTTVPSTNLLAPPGQFFLAGSDPAAYSLTGDPTGTAPDSLVLQSSTAPMAEFGTVMTNVDPTPYFGKRVQLSATVRTDGAQGWAGLWMRVDGASGQLLQFDNMQNRSIQGTTPAATYTVVLDVASDATNLAYGVLLVGPGTVTVSSMLIEEVPTSVPSTNLANLWGSLGQFFLAGSDPGQYTNTGDPTGAAPDSLILQSTTAPNSQFGTVMTDIDPTPYLGKRLQLSATVRTANATGWAGLWMRVDGSDTTLLAFDNMQNRPITGTQAAASCNVVLDVDPSATNIAYGVLLDGSGEVTVSSLQVQVVSDSVHTTGS